jgi:hypothetical protein
MTLDQLIEEYADCHDSERRNYLKAEIEKHAKDHISRCIDCQMNV